ncbi:MAG: sulfurtransferase-like selenium metabolism protein YedF [Trichloromonadaceae bacterium]
MKILDCRGQVCPYPVVQARKLLLAEPGIPVEILVGDDIARDNITRLATTQGYQIAVAPTEGGFALSLTPSATAAATTTAPAFHGKSVLFLTADTLGQGNDELGRLLLKNYLFTLTELAAAPDVILLVNAGVRLACSGSEVREALDQLACLGSDIASCGLCLDFYHLKDQLQVGRVTNMLDIADTLHKAGRIIRP